MLYPKNNRYHSTYHEKLFYEPSKDVADARTQSYFNWYKGDKNNIKDKNFYPSRWPRITNNERNYSHDVFKFANTSSTTTTDKHSSDRFSRGNIDNWLKEEQKQRREISNNHINAVRLSRERRDTERWNKIVNKDIANEKKIVERRLHSKTNKPGKGFNIINNQYTENESGRELALIDSIEKQKVNYLSLKKYERMNTYNPVKGYDIKKRLPEVATKLEPVNNHSLHNDNSAASVEPIYYLNVNNQSNATNQLEHMLMSSNSELKRRRERMKNPII
ncbi:hypothetical protein BCR36DRAFT_408637 [Piromyces finnis]|uniref:Uncharacterized protein n=1 Tax=Piromyces finnis TaxID=1754191 RepID=A0A1Y1VKX0_9FUNG|nr:hypothetical protein BCR36DRAFT_408637 [Piromyces finnis]|eukprot:ORX59108.1 hypothetical protein BCR36DRAFT_408637 [Piromyces finnis]